MSDVLADPLDKPAEIPLGNRPEAKKHWITKENAKQLAAKAWEKKRERQRQLLEAERRDKDATPQSAQLARQIKQIEDLMDGERDADTLQKLSAAHARLFSAWQVLTGTPNPGSRKAGKSRNQPVSPILPTEPETPSP